MSLLHKNVSPLLSMWKARLSWVGLVGGRVRDARDVSWSGGRVDWLHSGHLPDQAWVVDHDGPGGGALDWRAILTKTQADRLGELVVQGGALPHHYWRRSSPCRWDWSALVGGTVSRGDGRKDT